jgi:hypothetical protein
MSQVSQTVFNPTALQIIHALTIRKTYVVVVGCIETIVVGTSDVEMSVVEKLLVIKLVVKNVVVEVSVCRK